MKKKLTLAWAGSSSADNSNPIIVTQYLGRRMCDSAPSLSRQVSFVSWWLRSLLAMLIPAILAVSASAALTHRYSFNDGVTDSVGGANGVIHNGVTLSGGVASFSGSVPSGPACSYIELPPGLIGGYPAVTFEFWANVGRNGQWEEIFAFGTQNLDSRGANLLMFTPHSGERDYRMSYGPAAPAYADEYVINGLGVLDSRGPMSVTCVYDPPNNSMSLYTNGVLVATRWPVADGFSLTNIYNSYSWLGRSMYNGDASYAGTLDEFRIYNAALGPLQIAVDHLVGPNSVVSDIPVNSFAWNVNPNMALGERQDTTVTFDTIGYGTLTVSGSTEATYASTDPAIVSVNVHGQLFAMATGQAHISARHGNQTNTVLVTVGQPALTHRYSFTTNAGDSVGNAHGTLFGTAAINNGVLELSGAGTSRYPDAYLNLPNNLVTGYTSISIEAWVTDIGSATWARIWDFGNSGGGEGVSDYGTRYMNLALPAGNGDLSGQMRLNNRAGGDQWLWWTTTGDRRGARKHTSSGSAIGRIILVGSMPMACWWASTPTS